MNESTPRLLDAVQALTEPTVENIKQTDDEGKYLRTHPVEHLPLLVQLRDAVMPNAAEADRGGGKSLPAHRNIIDADALYRYAKIVAAIEDWCRMMKVDKTKDPIAGLQRWYVAYTAYQRETEEWYVAELRKWAGQIRNQLDPPRRIQIVVPCPVCRSDFWTDEDGQSLAHPLMIEYRLADDGHVVRPRAMCRATDCGAVWDSFASIEELAEELTEPKEVAHA